MSDLTGQYLGQYQILGRISKGSTSTIYKAYQPKLDRCVAIKVLSPHVVDEEGFLARFSQEARAVAQLDHPNIVPVYDFDQVGDAVYIVFKYVESGSLRSLMPGHPMELSLAVEIITQVGLALGYAHRRGVIHRDVKPGNVLIAEGRWALLTDFGLAKILSGGKKLTRSGIGMGTPDYMSPEQAQGLPGDGRADLYSLGVMLYEMLTGRVPFESDSSMGVVVKHITETPPPPRQFNPDIPEEVEKVILAALEKNPNERFQTAEAMIAALVRAAGTVAERPTLPSFDLAAVSVARLSKGGKSTLQSSWARIKEIGARVWKQARDTGAQVTGRLKDNWGKLSLRNRMILSGAALACLALFVILAGLPLMHSSAQVNGLLAPTSAHVENTPAPAAPGAKPTYPTQPAATSEWTLLPSSAPIRPGIYVKVVRPNGFDMFKEAGFDKDFITTLSSGKILYVLQGPVRADTLSWIKVSDGVTVGWGVQDHVVAYGIKNAP